MNLRSVQLFRMIVRTGSLASAAARLNVSSSAASRMLAGLEHELQLTLFSRHNRNLVLTAQGSAFLRRTQHILEGVERLPDIAAQIRSDNSEPLRLVSTVPLATSVLAPVLALWHQEVPQARSVLNIETRFDLETKVAAREYNLGIMSLPVENAIVDLDIHPLLDARYEIAMAPGHPLARQDHVTVQDLRGQRFVTLRAQQRWRQRLDRLAAANDMVADIVCETASTTVALDLVSQGLGICLADRMIAGLRDTATLVQRPLEPALWTQYCLVTGRGRTSKATAAFSVRVRDWLQGIRATDPTLAASIVLAPEEEPRGRA